MIRLPTPRAVKDKFYALQGLYTDQDEGSWVTLWRLFKASLYHTALHAAYSDFGRYAVWAKGKDLTLATYPVSLVEDLHVTAQAAKRWPGILPDIAYANYISGLRATDPAAVGRGSFFLRMASWPESFNRRASAALNSVLDWNSDGTSASA